MEFGPGASFSIRQDSFRKMNRYQELWWRQSESDHAAFQLLRGHGPAVCHTLHYLQMTTEKLAKAYFWRSGLAPQKSHIGFVKFLQFLGQISHKPHRDKVAALFGFNRFADFQNWLKMILPIAYDLERLTPDLANDGPNPEYPWPHIQPEFAPALYTFKLWSTLEKGQGRDLMRFIQTAVARFPEYADY